MKNLYKLIYNCEAAPYIVCAISIVGFLLVVLAGFIGNIFLAITGESVLFFTLFFVVIPALIFGQ